MKPILLFYSLMMIMYLHGNDFKPAEQTWVQNDISITARLEKDTYRFYEPILLKIIYQNNSTETIHITRINSKIRNFNCVIVNEETQAVVPWTLKGKKETDFFSVTFSRSTLSIESNKEYVHEIYLNGYFDLTLQGQYILSLNPLFYNSEWKKVPLKIENLKFKIIDDLQP